MSERATGKVEPVVWIRGTQKLLALVKRGLAVVVRSAKTCPRSRMERYVFDYTVIM